MIGPSANASKLEIIDRGIRKPASDVTNVQIATPEILTAMYLSKVLKIGSPPPPRNPIICLGKDYEEIIPGEGSNSSLGD